MKSQPQAIKPDLFADFRKVLKEKETKGKPIQDIEETQLLEMAELPGWQVLKEYIDNLKADVEAINYSSMQSGASFEDIGRNAVVIQLTKDLLTKIVQKVEDVREARRTTE